MEKTFFQSLNYISNSPALLLSKKFWSFRLILRNPQPAKYGSRRVHQHRPSISEQYRLYIPKRGVEILPSDRPRKERGSFHFLSCKDQGHQVFLIFSQATHLWCLLWDLFPQNMDLFFLCKYIVDLRVIYLCLSLLFHIMERSQIHKYTKKNYTSTQFVYRNPKFFCLCNTHPENLSGTNPHRTNCVSYTIAHPTWLLQDM